MHALHQLLIRSRLLALCGASAATVALPFGATTSGGRVIKISGSAELTYDKQEAVPVPGQDGHIVMTGETKGVNKNTGSTDYFADAEVTNVEAADLAQGNGSHHGYYVMSKDGAAVVAQWSGTVTTTVGADQQPLTTFKGTWHYASGTGAYAGIRGSGTYEGHFTAKDRYDVAWQGSYSK